MPKIKEYPTREYFDKYFSYEPNTGRLLWKINRSHARVGREVGSLQKNGYLKVRFENNSYYVHRIVWVICYGGISHRETIDHVDGDVQNNRIENLRAVAMATQSLNKRLYKTNTSGYPGVYERNGKWAAATGEKGKKIWLGTFASKEEAGRWVFMKTTPTQLESGM